MMSLSGRRMVIPQRQACFAEPSSATTTAGVIDQLQLRFLLAKAPLAVGLLKEGARCFPSKRRADNVHRPSA